MSIVHNLGFPRIGAKRELKTWLESYWQGELDAAGLLANARSLREKHWMLQRGAGVERVPVGDAALYDHVLDALVLVGALPQRFGLDAVNLDLTGYFTLARGNQQHHAMEMTKWFDTNYHYLVPEWRADTTFTANPAPLLGQVQEARALGINAKPVLVGPLTLLWLGKVKDGSVPLELAPQLTEAYAGILAALANEGVEWVQIDEPILALDLPQAWQDAFAPVYARLAEQPVKLLLATYFGGVAQYRDLINALPVAGVHLDLVRDATQLAVFLPSWPQQRVLSLGVVNGRNVWRADLSASLRVLEQAKRVLGDNLWIAPSCSLLHSPIDVAQETGLDVEIKTWLAFAVQKLNELKLLQRGLHQGRDRIVNELSASYYVQQSRNSSTRVHNPQLAARLAVLPADADRRASAYPVRAAAQAAWLKLPKLPTTTIGSFPQTVTIRAARAAFKRGELTELDYQAEMKAAIAEAVARQEALDLDVLVHGEAERNDMVEYFGEQLQGYLFTCLGWVQSYGSRCVKPPIIYGDVSRVAPMTVAWSVYAQSLTQRPMKGMLTGPVTMLQWSFVRDDIERSAVAKQLALALNDEVRDLEAAGIRVIQIDEPALREGLPLKKADWDAYLAWAGTAFRLSVHGIDDATQVHTHMCYAEFNDILPAIAALDADVITIETSRSDMELLSAFGEFEYPNQIGPGVYDIHSPRVPSETEIERLLEKALTVIPVERLWVNPDCGLKTRAWPEVDAVLSSMMAVTKRWRARLDAA